jgi:microcystin degradation protein MlrC
MEKQVYFKTSDGNLFYTKNTAENHARTLADRTVKEIDGKDGQLSVSTSHPFQEADLSKLTKKQLIEKGAALGLTLSEEATKAELIKAIEYHVRAGFMPAQQTQQSPETENQTETNKQ